MNKLKVTLLNNDIKNFKTICKSQLYLNEKEIFSILNIIIKEKKLDFFEIAMENYLSPQIFWETSKSLVKNNEYEFIKVLIKISRNSEKDVNKKNFYADQLLYEFIDKDNLYFVDYLVTKEKSSTENMLENQLTVLNECIKNNSIKCFDYFLSNGKNVHDLDDIALFTALDNKKYDILELIINNSKKINPSIEENFYRYGKNKNQKDISNREFLLLGNISKPFLEKSIVLQNRFVHELIKRGLLEELEESFKKGYSPIGDKNYDLMSLAITLKKNKIKTVKLLLDYGSNITDDQEKSLKDFEINQIKLYPRFNKIKENLENKFTNKVKNNLIKI